jgi:hypothetical protein
VKTRRQIKADYRHRMRKAGYVLKQIWVLPASWPKVKAYLKRAKGAA